MKNNSHSTVLLAIKEQHLYNKLPTKLKQIGFNVIEATTFNDLVSELNPSIDILLLESSFCSHEDSNVNAITTATKSLVDLRIIFLAANEDIAAKLFAVRIASFTIFNPPYDMSRIIDKIEYLTYPVANEPFKVLLIEDNDQNSATIKNSLTHKDIELTIANSIAVVNRELIDFTADLVMINFNFSGVSAIELAQIIRAQDAFVDTPLIFLAEKSDIRTQIQAFNLGTDDFLELPINPQLLLVTIVSRARRYRALRQLMIADSLTGLLNHTNILEHLENEILRCRRQQYCSSMALLDLDNFKKINDDYGHSCGDRVLKILARLLQSRLRRTDIIGRYGGEEFMIIFPNTDAATAQQIMQQLLQQFGSINHSVDDHEFNVTFSAGVVEFSHQQKLNYKQIFNLADNALYQAKTNGKKQVALATHA